MYILKCSNLKVSCKVQTKANPSLIEGSRHSSFTIVKENGFCYTFFHSGGHVNITGVKDTEYLLSSLWTMKKVLQDSQAKITDVKIDNMLMHCDLGSPLDVRKVHTKIKARDEEGFFSCTFNVDAFPGLQIKTGEGTLVLFSSGKIVIHCSQEPLEIRTLLALICQIVLDHGRETM